MNTPRTILQICGMNPQPARFSDSVVVVIDAQKEYTEGKLPLKGIDGAVAEGAKILAKARELGTPIVHIIHKTAPGAPIVDPETIYSEIIDTLEPVEGEVIVEKTLPSGFSKTNLDVVLKSTGRTSLIVFGFATHMCVSTTVRDAILFGYRTTVVADACASRDLPDPLGGVISADEVHRANLAAMADRFAVVVKSVEDLAE